MGSVVFAGVIGSMAFVALMSSVIVSLLCLKMKRLKDTEASVDNQLNTKTDQIGVSLKHLLKINKGPFKNCVTQLRWVGCQ